MRIESDQKTTVAATSTESPQSGRNFTNALKQSASDVEWGNNLIRDDISENIDAVDFSVKRNRGAEADMSLSFVNNGSYFKDWTIQVTVPYEIKEIKNAEIVSRDGNTYTIRATRANDDVFAGEKTTIDFVAQSASGNYQSPENISFQQGGLTKAAGRTWFPTAQIERFRDRSDYWQAPYDVSTQSRQSNAVFKQPVLPFDTSSLFQSMQDDAVRQSVIQRGAVEQGELEQAILDETILGGMRQQNKTARARGNTANDVIRPTDPITQSDAAPRPVNKQVSGKAIRLDFENQRTGSAYTRANQQKDLDVAFAKKDADFMTEIVAGDAISGNKALRVEYGPDKITAVGTAFKVPPQKEYYVQYSVKFDKDFDFDGPTRSAGKLPGLGSASLASGGVRPNGANGFTSRVMWTENGRAKLYTYHMDQPDKWGHNTFFKDGGQDVHFQRGQWHTITQRVRINDGNQKNGEIEAWMDGKRVASRSGLRFVNNGTKIDKFFLSTFFGGNSKEFLPNKTVGATFDNFIISADKNDVARNG